MICPIYTEQFHLPAVNRREILRYAGAREETPELSLLLDEALAEVLPVVTGRVCWMEFDLTWQKDTLDLGFSVTDSAALMRNLAGCHRAVVFAATVGLPLDRLITRYTRLSPAKALLIQAIGAERIETLCDEFCEKIRRTSGLFAAPRFSPGYGDFPLELQKDIFRILNCSRNIGLTLNESLLMSPSKSVTAIVGLKTCGGSESSTGCSCCSKTDCAYRRTK